MKFDQTRKTIAGILLTFVFCELPNITLVRSCPAQTNIESKEASIDAEKRLKALDTIINLLNEKYVFPDIAKKIETLLRSNLKDGKYDELTTASGFAKSVENDLRETSKDIHLSFFYDAKLFETLTKGEDKSVRFEKEAADRANEKYNNFGFNKVARLDGNIGYLELLHFSSYVGDDAGEAAVSAMNFIRNSDAVIIDLRKNPGGSGRMGQLLSSYFFHPDDDQWLISNHNRSAGTTNQEWTFSYVPGKRMPDVDLYILIGPNTGSAAEGFAYNLQALKRATIVGERSAGGAHSGEMVAVTSGLVMFVPSGRTINPITNTNWEGSGVNPDVGVKSKDALIKAQILALEKLQNKFPDGQKRAHAKWLLKSFYAELSPVIIGESILKQYVGKYEGHSTVTLRSGELFFQSKNKKDYKLIALDEDLFTVEGADYYGVGRQRIQFMRNEKGEVTKTLTFVNYDSGKVAVFEDKKIN